jgi:hypothetical protein
MKKEIAITSKLWMDLLFILRSNWLWTEMLFYHTLYLLNISFLDQVPTEWVNLSYETY